MHYLYVKTHNKTGLKYLGKTSKCDPYSYKGSGKYWVKHIDKHGYDVNTEILLATEDLTELKDTGIFFSKLWNIVESNEWANLMMETGTGGPNPNSQNIEAKQKRYQTLKKNNKTWTHNQETRKVMSKAAKEYWDSDKAAKRKGKEFFGPPKPPSWLVNNQAVHKCPHCDKTGDLRNMKRWHFDNCKLVP